MAAWGPFVVSTLHLHAELERDLKRAFDVTLLDHGILLMLRNTPDGLTMGHLAGQFGTEASVITYRVNRLEERGACEARPARHQPPPGARPHHQGRRTPLRPDGPEPRRQRPSALPRPRPATRPTRPRRRLHPPLRRASVNETDNRARRPTRLLKDRSRTADPPSRIGGAHVDVYEAVRSRRAVRAIDATQYQARPDRVLGASSAAPSSGNLQPWQVFVVSGEPLARLKKVATGRAAGGDAGDPRQYPMYPEPMGEPYHDRFMRAAVQRYSFFDVDRDDPERPRKVAMMNAGAFGAPVVLFCELDARVGPGQWADAGMYLRRSCSCSAPKGSTAARR